MRETDLVFVKFESNHPSGSDPLTYDMTTCSRSRCPAP